MGAKIKPVLVGSVFGRWITIDECYFVYSPVGVKKKMVLCRCDCGQERGVLFCTLKNGTSLSCGCLRDELFIKRSARHMLCSTPEYKIWVGIRSRCNSPSATAYHHYGGRGITICDAWMSDFMVFLSDMGKKPGPKHQIDRINVNGNYSPENCRWVTATVNANNRRNNVRYDFNGVSLTASEWARQADMPLKCLAWRLKAGWGMARALGK